jgi:hypothetical protein
MVVVTGVSEPEVPVTVIVDEPVAAVEAAVKVRMLVVVAGLVPIATVTPVGRVELASVTLPVNPFRSVTVTVLVPVLPGATVTVEGEAASVKPGVPLTMSETVVVADGTELELPVMVIGYVPATVVEATVRVRTLEVADEVGLKAAVTPVGMPDAVKATLPVNGATSVTVMVSVPLAPAATVRVAAEGFSVKLPSPPPLQAVPLIAKFVGTALAEPFQVPLKPIPVRVAPAATLPL